MTTRTFIKFDGVDGESVDADHRGQIDVLWWTWGVSNSSASVTAPGTGSGAGVGKAVATDISFGHVFDKASPLLAKKCVQGVHIPTVVLTSRKAGEGQKDFLKITLTDVRVVAIQQSAGDDHINETVSIGYSEIEVAYKPQDATGALGAEVKFKWNLKTTAVA